MFIKALSVTQVTEYIKRIFNADAILRNVSITGEISNFKHHYSGHMYFTLKDDNCRIKCVMFKSSCSNLNFYPEDGMSVTVSGYVSVYDKDGQYQVYATQMMRDGIGALYMAYEQLKKKLEEEGLFSPLHKVPIPKYPSKVGVVTSSTGAAVRDVINIISRRAPGVEIVVVPVLVQGSEAPPDIAAAIEFLNTRDDIDVIITGRGGGSIEELWAFNEEIVARAIYNSRIPVISAVGHETDFTIADFVSDLRAPTPSAAAELAVQDTRELTYKLNSCKNTLYNFMASDLKYRRNLLSQFRNTLNTLSPSNAVNQKAQYLDSLNFKMISMMNHKLDLYRERMSKYGLNLDALSPLSVLGRGYSITCKSGSREVVDDTGKVRPGDSIDVHVKNGYLKCSVDDICEGETVIEKQC